MRTLLPILVALVLFAGLGIPARAQDASKIVDQYINAAGGAKGISKIQSLAIEGTFTSASDRKAGTFTFDAKLPNRYYSELVAGDKTWIEAYSGKSAWHENGDGEIATLLGQESSQLETAGQYYNVRLLNLKKNKLALSLMGHAQVRGRLRVIRTTRGSTSRLWPPSANRSNRQRKDPFRRNRSCGLF